MIEDVLLQGLNESQKKAVLKTEGRVLVLAGAGSGKTRVLTTRIAHLIKEGVNPWQILAITFTNKAANEMKERVSSITSDANQTWIGTFHSIFFRILSTNIHLLGMDQFTLIDDADQKSIIKKASEHVGFDVDKKIQQIVMSQISIWKNEGILPGDAMSISQGSKSENELAQVYQLYEMEKEKHNYFDFDDLLLKSIHLFNNNPELLGKYQNLFKYILVDEFQDTNEIQFRLIEMLSTKHKNVFLVGDPDQSIYSFRSAKIENILNYQQMHPDTVVINLKENYRSTRNIVEASNSLVERNKERLSREAISVGEQGDNIHVIQLNDASREADFIARLISNLHRDEGRKWSDFAILYRLNYQSKHIELALRDEGVPYRVVGSTSFYDRKEIKDIVSYIRTCYNLHDDYAIQRIINVPKRSIGKTTIDKISSFAAEKKITFFKALENIDAVKEEKKINNPTTQRIKDFVSLIKNLVKETQSYEDFSANRFVNLLLRRTDFMTQFDHEKEEDLNRIENVTQFRNYAKHWDTCEKEEQSLAQFLSEISLDSSEDDEEEDDYVTLTSVHSSKGLEWSQVFVIGMEDDVFPHFRSKTSLKEMEEERRLAYVAMTRAADRLFFSYSNYRFDYNSSKPIRQHPSPFIDEIPEEYKVSVVQTA